MSSEIPLSIKLAKEIIGSLFQLDRLERLAQKNSVVAMAYAEIIMHINFVLLTWDRDIKLKSGLLEQISDVVSKTLNIDFPGGSMVFKGNDFAEKMSAIGFCFAHDAGKLDEALSIGNFQQFAIGMDKMMDFVGSAVQAGKTIQNVSTSRGKKKP